MRINLYDILSAIGKEQTVSVTFPERQELFQGEKIEVSCEDAFDITLKHSEKDILEITTDPVMKVQRSCSRCLDDVLTQMPLSIHRIADVVKKQDCADDSGEYDCISYIEDCTLDVDMLILDELYTTMPMKVLCREDCKGICKVCGTNLNKKACTCDQTVPDPRMAVFSDIFNQFKEV